MSCSMSGVPRITSIYSFVIPRTMRKRPKIFTLDMRPKAIRSPSGREKSKVQQKILMDFTIPPASCSKIIAVDICIPPETAMKPSLSLLLSDADQISDIVLLSQLCDRSVLCQLSQVSIYDITKFGVALLEADCIFLGV